MPESNSLLPNHDASTGAERRQHERRHFHSLSYVQLDEMNGGILLNVSEGGLAVHAAMSVMEDDLAHIRLQPPHSRARLETAARVAWTGDSRRMVGIEFKDPSGEFRAQLREWLAAEAAAAASAELLASAMPSEADIAESAAPVTHSTLPRSLRALATAAAPLPEQRKIESSSTAATVAAKTEAAEKEPISALTLGPSRQPSKEIALAAAAAPVMIAAERPPLTTAAPATDANAPRRYVPALIFLAALSLFAGWEAGRGNVFSAFFSSSSAVSASGAATAVQPTANPVFANFLVIDATNQSWLVPFAGPTDVAKVPPSPVLPPQSPAARAALEAASGGGSQSQNTYHVGTLYAPQTSSRAAKIQPAASAPTLPTAAPSVGLPSSLADTTSRLNLPPPVPLAASTLVPATVTRKIDPVYPAAAIQQRVQGAVRIQAHIGADGVVSNVRALSGSAMLTPAAIAAVRRWQYKPEILDGHPVASDIDLTVQFNLPQ